MAELRRPVQFLVIAIVGALAMTLGVTTIVLTTAGALNGGISGQAAPLAKLSTAGAEGSTVYASDGTTVIAVLHASVTRTPIALSAVAPILQRAVLATEDERFYLHGGVDLLSTLRALISDTGGGALQGGSTITQQLVKQLYLTSERTLSRKIKEAVLADRLEQHYTKNQILDAYLNTIYLGNGAYGVQAAAATYFDLSAKQLDLPQAALLAGMIQDPVGDDPIAQTTSARSRRSEVLQRMVHYHVITQAQSNAANDAPLPTALNLPPSLNAIGPNAYYVSQVQSDLLSNNSPLGGNYTERYNALFEGGLKIITNLNPVDQAAAESAVTGDTPQNSGGFEEALVSIDPTNGKVVAMVGGPGYAQSKFDVVTQGHRQAGSGFKIFTLIGALEQGYSPYDIVNATAPCAISFPGNPYYVTHPATNDEGPGSGGQVSLIIATADSYNCGYLRLGHEVGLSNIAATAESMGVQASELTPTDPSMILGADTVEPIEMADAYATVADNGVYHAPSFVQKVIDRTGSVVYAPTNPGKQVFSAQIAEEADLCFQAVVQYGTGTAAYLYGREVAGKTGTTTSVTDAWFNGYTPQIEATVWMGNPTNTTSMYDVGGYGEVYGGDFPTFTVHDYLQSALVAQPVLDFASPDSSQLPPTKQIISQSLINDDFSSTTTPATAPPVTVPSSTTTSNPFYVAPIPPTGTTTPSFPVQTTPIYPPIFPSSGSG
ncbi:MAG: transglycosylase domain-containing protein [Acidimicrobiales bacterium]